MWDRGSAIGRIQRLSVRLNSMVRGSCSCMYVFFYLVAEGLRWVVDDYGSWEVAAQDAEIFDVVTVHTDTVVSEQTVPGRRSGQISTGHRLTDTDIAIVYRHSGLWTDGTWPEERANQHRKQRQLGRSTTDRPKKSWNNTLPLRFWLNFI